jgi:hypothetical protein
MSYLFTRSYYSYKDDKNPYRIGGAFDSMSQSWGNGRLALLTDHSRRMMVIKIVWNTTGFKASSHCSG